MEDIEITCPNCKIQLPAELKRVLMSGTTVTCENCGVVLVPKVQGEPKQVPAQKEQETTSVRQAVRQAIKQAKASIAEEIHKSMAAGQRQHPGITKPAAHVQPAQPMATAGTSPPPAATVPERPASQPSPIAGGPPSTPPEHHGKGGSDRRKGLRRGTPEFIAARKLVIEKAKKNLRAYNEASLVLMRLFLAIFYFVSIGTLLYDALLGKPFFPGLVQQTPLYIIGAYLHWYETHRIHEWVKQGVYEFYGIDMIVVGILGCMVCGIGVFMLIKGFIVMGIMIAQDEITPKAKRDVLIGWINGLDEVSWQVMALAAAAAFIIAASIILRDLFSLVAPPMQLIALIVAGTCGIVAANNDFTKVSRYCREWKFDGLGGKSLAFGIIGCICFGSGVPMLAKAILLFALDSVDKKAISGQKLVEQPLPRHDADQPAPLPAVQPVPAEKAAGPQKPLEPVVPSIPVQPAAQLQKPAPSPARAPRAASKKPPSLPPKPADSVEAFLQRNFNVLTPRSRKRLLKLKKLGVGDDDIEAIAEELVHHPEFEQLEIIDEYIQLNKADEVDPVHVHSVRAMNYDENTKKWMLDQLRTIPDKDIPAFIDEMKRNQPTP
ncbi:MAG: hypothetical protein Q6373_003615 [Candidatus Sigynarchaeota archaeon]